MTTTTSTRPTALVLGANGRFGLAASQAFSAAGWQVIAPLRQAPAPGMPAGARILRTPIDDTAQLAQQAAGAQVVVYAVNPPYTRWAAQMLPLARAGMDVAQRLSARLLLPGNIYNFGASMPPLLREGTVKTPAPARAHCASRSRPRWHGAAPMVS